MKFGSYRVLPGLIRSGACLVTVRPCSGVRFESTKITNALMDANTLYQLDKYSKYSPAPISIKHLLDHGKQSDARGSFLFLKKEIPTRISIHMLIAQYNALCGDKPSMDSMVGTIDQKCNILQVAHDAYEAASHLCDGEYFNHPRLVATAHDFSDDNLNTQGDVTVTYVPAHLHHIFFEIFKNSMRATCEFSEKRALDNLPEISCSIFKTKEDITIKISDMGGGVSRKMKKKVFNYMFSTAPGVITEEGSYGTLGLENDLLPMHGLGYGLPLSRVYARYFKGDIVMASVDGYGTDTYVYLQRLSHLATENLPIYNSSSSAKLKSISTQVPDWTDSANR